jgi:hypothetical protein
VIGTRVEHFNLKKMKRNPALRGQDSNAPKAHKPAAYGFEVGLKVKTTSEHRQQKVN